MKKITILFFCLLSVILVNAQVDSIYRDISQLKRNIIKIKPTSFFFGYTQVTYERNISAKRSFEINLGLIGLGRDYAYERDPLGLAIRGGYKFYLGNRETKGSFMRGLYLMPELAFCMYDKNVRVRRDWVFGGLIKSSSSTIMDDEGRKEYDRYRKYYGALIGTFGYQSNLDRFVIDINCGIGFGIYNPTRETPPGFFDFYPEDEHHFGFYGGNEGSNHFVISLNFKIGYMF